MSLKVLILWCSMVAAMAADLVPYILGDTTIMVDKDALKHNPLLMSHLEDGMPKRGVSGESLFAQANSQATYGSNKEESDNGFELRDQVTAEQGQLIGGDIRDIPNLSDSPGSSTQTDFKQDSGGHVDISVLEESQPVYPFQSQTAINNQQNLWNPPQPDFSSPQNYPKPISWENAAGIYRDEEKVPIPQKTSQQSLYYSVRTPDVSHVSQKIHNIVNVLKQNTAGVKINNRAPVPMLPEYHDGDTQKFVHDLNAGTVNFNKETLTEDIENAEETTSLGDTSNFVTEEPQEETDFGTEQSETADEEVETQGYSTESILQATESSTETLQVQRDPENSGEVYVTEQETEPVTDSSLQEDELDEILTQKEEDMNTFDEDITRNKEQEQEDQVALHQAMANIVETLSQTSEQDSSIGNGEDITEYNAEDTEINNTDAPASGAIDSSSGGPTDISTQDDRVTEEGFFITNIVKDDNTYTNSENAVESSGVGIVDEADTTSSGSSTDIRTQDDQVQENYHTLDDEESVTVQQNANPENEPNLESGSVLSAPEEDDLNVGADIKLGSVITDSEQESSILTNFPQTREGPERAAVDTSSFHYSANPNPISSDQAAGIYINNQKVYNKQLPEDPPMYSTRHDPPLPDSGLLTWYDRDPINVFDPLRGSSVDSQPNQEVAPVIRFPNTPPSPPLPSDNEIITGTPTIPGSQRPATPEDTFGESPQPFDESPQPFDESAQPLDESPQPIEGAVFHSVERESLSKSTCRCGLRFRPRIVGGDSTTIEQFPWMAGIASKFDNFTFCGGSIINDRYILTAAHCLYGQHPGDMYVRLGETTRDITKSLNIDVKKFIIHNRYNPDVIYKDDIALIELQEEIPEFTETMFPVCLTIGKENFKGDRAVVSGWGRNSFGGDVASGLMEATVKVLSTKQCQKKSSYQKHEIHKKIVCALGRNIDACQGDSGGPLVVTQGDQYAQLGVVSWGIGCAQKDYPGIYTRVSSYSKWILMKSKNGNTCARGKNKKRKGNKNKKKNKNNPGLPLFHVLKKQNNNSERKGEENVRRQNQNKRKGQNRRKNQTRRNNKNKRRNPPKREVSDDVEGGADTPPTRRKNKNKKENDEDKEQNNEREDDQAPEGEENDGDKNKKKKRRRKNQNRNKNADKDEDEEVAGSQGQNNRRKGNKKRKNNNNEEEEEEVTEWSNLEEALKGIGDIITKEGTQGQEEVEEK